MTLNMRAEAPTTEQLKAGAARAAAEAAAVQGGFYNSPLVAKPPQPSGIAVLKPLRHNTDHVFENGDHQRRHFVSVRDRAHLDALLAGDAESARLFSGVETTLLDFDRVEFRVGGDAPTLIDAIVLRPNGTLSFAIAGETPLGGAIEAPKATGRFYVWRSGDTRRFCVIDPKGRVVEQNFTVKQNAEFAAHRRNIEASPVATASGR